MFTRPAPLSLQCLIKLLRVGVRRGYSFTSPNPIPDVVSDYATLSAQACGCWFSGARVLIILPSTCSRCSPEVHAEVLRHILRQVREIPSGALVFALQGSDREQLLEHLEAVEEALGSAARDVLFFPVQGLGKTAALNAVVRHITANAVPELVGWVDDDVKLGQGTLGRLAAAMIADPKLLVVGAKKEPIAYQGRAARAFLWLKRMARPEGTLFWPHGCAIMLRSALVKEDIPLRYGGEDGYIVLKAFGARKTERSNVQLINGTSCRHVVGGPWWEIVPRVRRTLFENTVLLADFPSNTSLAFARDAIFHGLYAPNASAAARLLGAAHFLFYMFIGLSLLVRGLVGMPKRSIAWSGYSAHTSPRRVSSCDKKSARV